MFDLRKFHLTVHYDGKILEDTFCLGLVGNTKSIGGSEFFKKENVVLNDGYFECLFIRYPANVKEYQQIVQSILTNDYASCSNIIVFKTKALSIHSKTPYAWTIDGEFAGEHQDVIIKNLFQELNILK